MPDFTSFTAYKTSFREYLRPVITSHNRLEGNPRTEDFVRSLRAEVRDPLWMLCRQWQFGEYQGEDAASAVQAQILGTHRTPGSVTLFNGHTMPYDPTRPLEALIERERLTPDLYLRVQLGRQLFKFMQEERLEDHKKALLEKFPISEDPDPTAHDDPEGHYLFTAVQGRLADGYAAMESIKAGEFLLWADSIAANLAESAAFTAVEKRFVVWFSELYEQPTADESAWNTEHLEYNFALNIADEDGGIEQLTADQYASGRLDWYAFDEHIPKVKPEGAVPTPAEERVQTFLPTPLQYSGMPHPRYWQMEERRTHFGKLDPSPTSIINVLLAEYGLTYSNDWFILPYEMQINSVCEIAGLMVKDVFGLNIFIGPALQDPETNWRQFAVFHQTERQNARMRRNRFYLAPAVGKVLEGDPVEKVNFLRDEMANMVWGVEQTLPSGAGGGRLVKRNLSRLSPDFVPADEVSKIRYVIGSTVPDNWIPFIAVHKPVPAGATPMEIRLQRARLPQTPGPKSVLLTEKPAPFFIEEEEVPRAGIVVERRYQRTRWLNGRTCLWLGRRKSAGRGEGWSGLMFDQILDIKR
jgi:hypothetical protein